MAGGDSRNRGIEEECTRSRAGRLHKTRVSSWSLGGGDGAFTVRGTPGRAVVAVVDLQGAVVELWDQNEPRGAIGVRETVAMRRYGWGVAEPERPAPVVHGPGPGRGGVAPEH